MPATKKVIVILGASSVTRMMPILLHQLLTADIPTHIETMRGSLRLREKIVAQRRLVEEFSEFEWIVFSDAHDVLFFGDRVSLIEAIDQFSGVTHAAEKNCFPYKIEVPDRGPWRYANGGLSCGTPKAYLEWLAHLEQIVFGDGLDQDAFNQMLWHNDPMMRIDFQTRLFFCLYGGYEELAFVNGRPLNTHWNTRPLFIHANGNWPADEVFSRYQESLCLPKK